MTKTRLSQKQESDGLEKSIDTAQNADLSLEVSFVVDIVLDHLNEAVEPP